MSDLAVITRSKDAVAKAMKEAGLDYGWEISYPLKAMTWLDHFDLKYTRRKDRVIVQVLSHDKAKEFATAWEIWFVIFC